MGPRLLVTGTASGLGRALRERFGGTALTRDDDPRDLADGEPFDTIIHCAANTRDPAEGDSLHRFLDDNVFLTERLLDVPHRLFVYVSSTEVYPKNGALHAEDESLDLGAAATAYASAKLVAETRVRLRAAAHLVLRPTALLGRHARPNSLSRMMRERGARLTLAAGSTFNYVRHETVGDFVEKAVAAELRGIYNIASTGNVTLAEIAERHGRRPEFGTFRYTVGRIDNRRASAVLAALDRATMDVVDEFLREGPA